MAYLTLNRDKLRHNYRFLDCIFRKNSISWAVVSKLLCGNELYLRELAALKATQLCDARISNLRTIKKIDPGIQTIYIKPPPPRIAAAVVRYADISFNSQYKTLQLLSEEAVRQKKIHQVIITVEMGERREGVTRTHITEFYEKAYALPGIRILGVGTNFACLSGVLPSRSKLEELAACRDKIEQRYNVFLPYISGGSSVAIPLLFDDNIPDGVNHFRVGESLFFGTDVYNNRPLKGMRQDVFTLYAEIIELTHKSMTPDGELGRNLEGHVSTIIPEDRGKTTWRAIVDVGLLDVESHRLTPTDRTIKCIGASSDMLVVNLGKNSKNYKTGDYIEFRTDYMGILRLMMSRYIDKRVAGSMSVKSRKTK